MGVPQKAKPRRFCASPWPEPSEGRMVGCPGTGWLCAGIWEKKKCNRGLRHSRCRRVMGLLCNGPLEVAEETPRCAAALLGFGMRSTCAHRDFCETLKRRKLLLQSSSCPSSLQARGQGGFQLWGVCSPGGLEIGRERWDRELDESEQGSFLL